MFKQAAFLAIAILLVGCGKTQSDNAQQASSSAASTKPKIVYIPKNTGNPYFNQVDAGFKKASEQFGFSYDIQGPATADATSQLSVIKDAIQRGVDVICITPNSPDALNQVLDEAKAKGITIITVDADLTGNESHRSVAILPTDFAQIGPSQLELLGKLTNYQGDFAILSATTDAPNQNAWIAGIHTAMKDPKYAKMNLVATVYGDDESQKSSTEAEGLLARFPNLKGIIAPTSVGLAAAAQVLDNSGAYPGGPNAKNGGIQLTGLSTPNQLRKAVEKGVVTSFQLWSPEDMGFIAGYLGVQAKQKKLDFKPGTSIDVPGKGKATIGDKGVIYAGPLLTFDKSNISKYGF